MGYRFNLDGRGRYWAFPNLDQSIEEELDNVSPIAALLFVCVVSERS